MKTTLMPLIVLELAFAAVQDAAMPAAPRRVKAGDRFDGIILQHSQRARLNPRFVKAIIAVESEFSPNAVSPRGARGLMQLMPATAEEVGVSRARLGEPHPNIRAGTAYLNRLYRSARLNYGLKAERLHDAPVWVQGRVLAAYNGGPRFLRRNDWPAQTRGYVRKVMRLLRCPSTSIQPGAISQLQSRSGGRYG